MLSLGGCAGQAEQVKVIPFQHLEQLLTIASPELPGQRGWLRANTARTGEQGL